MRELHETDLIPPPRGTYIRMKRNGRPSATIACPACDRRGSLADSQKNGADGVGAPSVLCDCGFHDHVRLVGNLLGDPHQPVPIGGAVEGVFEHRPDGEPPYTLLQWQLTG